MALLRNVEPFIDIARGFQPGTRLNRVFGENAAITNVEEDIWAGGGIYVFNQSAASLTVTHVVASGDSNTGSGCRTLVLFGLDGSGVSITENITLSDVSPSETSQTFFRLNHAEVLTVGTYVHGYVTSHGANAGDITISAGTQKIGHILSGVGHAEESMYTIPASHTGYIWGMHMTVETSKTMNLKFWHRNSCLDTSVPVASKALIHEVKGLEGPNDIFNQGSISAGSLTDLWWSGIRTAAGNGAVDVQYEIVLVEDA